MTLRRDEVWSLYAFSSDCTAFPVACDVCFAAATGALDGVEDALLGIAVEGGEREVDV